MKILLLTPPMTQLNTPYPATAYLTGFLSEQGYETTQRDLAIDVFLSMLSRDGLDQIREVVEENYADSEDEDLPGVIFQFLARFDDYRRCVEPVVQFLQGKDPSLALRIVSRHFLPEGPRFDALGEMEAVAGDMMDWAFGDLGTQDKAKYLATLFIDDLADVIHTGVDPYFEISRYGERLAASNPSFDDLHDLASGASTFTGERIEAFVRRYLDEENPDVVGISAPFPGNMLGALQAARACKALRPDMPVVLGGGFVNTELRSLTDARVFRFFDYICYDDGERPLLTLLEYLQGRRPRSELFRTRYLEDGEVVYADNPTLHDFPHRDIGAPGYEGLRLDRYLSLCEMLNPMHRIWSDGRWLKLTIAHGCYWSHCTFCDLSLDYIRRYDEAGADLIVDRIEQLVAETGLTGFHFVDEAAPPKVLFALARRLIEKNIVITWWGNIRFEKTFTPARCRLLADSGCVAVSGGLEAASDRLLKKMQKGVTVEQVARITRAFADAGILVHAYLMYGFPTQTTQETVDSLERVRQMMLNGCFQSAYWHRFAATIHSPVGMHPDEFGVSLRPLPEVHFASNDVDFDDPVGADHEALGRGLNKALYNYMHGIGFEQPMQFWFDMPVGEPDIAPDYIERVLTQAQDDARPAHGAQP